MRKKYELSLSNTCMSSAHPEEMVFVLRSRDAAAPTAIRAWVAERIRIGKNTLADEQIVEALACADTMEQEGARWKAPTPPRAVMGGIGQADEMGSGSGSGTGQGRGGRWGCHGERLWSRPNDLRLGRGHGAGSLSHRSCGFGDGFGYGQGNGRGDGDGPGSDVVALA